MFCRVAAVKSLPVQRDHHSADHILWPFGIFEFISSHLENRVLLKTATGSVASVARFITGH